MAMMNDQCSSSSSSMGSKFRLTTEELFCFVTKKNRSPQYKSKIISDQSLYLRDGLAPWELFEREGVRPSQNYLYIFTKLKKTCSRKGGNWKTSSTSRMIQNPKTKQDMGFEKSLSFFVSGMETGWTMKVYYVDPNGWAVCRIDRGSKFPLGLILTTSTTSTSTAAAAAAASTRPSAPLQKLKRSREEEVHDPSSSLQQPIKKQAMKTSSSQPLVIDDEENITYDIPWDFAYFEKLEQGNLFFDEQMCKEILIPGDFWVGVPLAD